MSPPKLFVNIYSKIVSKSLRTCVVKKSKFLWFKVKRKINTLFQIISIKKNLFKLLGIFDWVKASFWGLLWLTFVVFFVNYFCLQNLNFLNFGKKFFLTILRSMCSVLQIILPKLSRMAYFKTSKLWYLFYVVSI